MIKRTYTKTVLIETLKDEIQESIPGIVQSILATDSFVTITPVSYTHLTLPTTPYV